MNNAAMFRDVVKQMNVEKEGNKIDWLPEDKACELLGITNKTIQNYISSGHIPSSFYVKTLDSKRLYNKNKLLILK